MSEEARLQKRRRIQENRRKRGISVPEEPHSVGESNQINISNDSIASPPTKKAPLSQESMTNGSNANSIDFSPRQPCQTPPAFGAGGSFSPPNSNASIKNSISPHIQQHRTLNIMDLAKNYTGTNCKSGSIVAQEMTHKVSQGPLR